MNAVVPFFQQANVPAELTNIFGDSNIAKRDLIPSLTFRGKVWRITVAGETHDLMNGDDPKPSVDVVVLAQLPRRSRSFYEGAFVEGENKAPRCWSTDGVKPDAEVTEPVAQTCANCPNSVKGSKITDNGKQVAACSQFRRLVVVPASDLGFEPLLLRIPQTSIWDKDNAENEQKGFYAWDQYIDMLRTRNVNHTAQVVTKLKFDKRMAYPKLLFGPVRFVSTEEAAVLKPLINSDSVKALLEMKTVDTYIKEQAETGAQHEEEEVPAISTKPTMKTVEASPPLPTGKGKKAAPAPASLDDDDDLTGNAAVAKPAKPAAAASAKSTKPAAAAPEGQDISKILDSWDD